MTDSTIDGKPNERALDHAPDLDEWFGDLERPADDGDARDHGESGGHWGEQVEDTTASDVFERIRAESPDAGAGAGEILADETPEDIIASADDPDDRDAIDDDLFDEGALDELLLTGRTEAQGFLWIETDDRAETDATEEADSMAAFYERAGLSLGDQQGTDTGDGEASAGNGPEDASAEAEGDARPDSAASVDADGDSSGDSMAEFYRRAGMDPPSSDSTAEESADSRPDPTTTLDDLYERAGMAPPGERESNGGDESEMDEASAPVDGDASQSTQTDNADRATDEGAPSESLADLYERAGIPLEGNKEANEAADEPTDEPGTETESGGSDASNETPAEPSSEAASNRDAPADSRTNGGAAAEGSRADSRRSSTRRPKRSDRNRRSRDDDDEEWEGLFVWLGQRFGKYF